MEPELNSLPHLLSESDIRSALHRHIRTSWRDCQPAVLVDELGLCEHSARVDVAVLGTYLCGYEIKSERDSLRRLSRQVEVYGLVFDHMSLVTVPHHLPRLDKLVPDWWSIVVADRIGSEVTLSTIRAGYINTQVQAASVAKLLWHDEVLRLLIDLGADSTKRHERRSTLWQRLAEKVSLDELRPTITRLLQTRTEWRPVELLS